MAISVLLRGSTTGIGLLVASSFGNQNFLDRRVAEGFRSGGTYHLLVISGLHLAMIASALLLAIRSLVRKRALRFTIVVASIWAFALMVGAQPAVTRAAAMISIALLSQGIFRRGSGANALGAFRDPTADVGSH
jgi:competence protein ComEC